MRRIAGLFETRREESGCWEEGGRCWLMAWRRFSLLHTTAIWRGRWSLFVRASIASSKRTLYVGERRLCVVCSLFMPRKGGCGMAERPRRDLGWMVASGRAFPIKLIRVWVERRRKIRLDRKLIRINNILSYDSVSELSYETKITTKFTSSIKLWTKK